jgi:lysozyme
VEKTIQGRGLSLPVVLLGVRGYYLDQGKPWCNDRGIYDDAIFLHAPNLVAGFNANCDPSYFQDGIACLQPGTWLYKLGIHGLTKAPEKQYEALVQADVVTIQRDNGPLETGFFGINIHKGSYGTTSSLGCQTVHPEQWDPFISTIKNLMAEHGQEKLPYLLIDQSEFKRSPP